MGMSTGGEKRSVGEGFNHDLNVTPLCDVMLVLLIIVMLIAPLLQAGILVTLPEASNTVEKIDNDNDTVVHVDENGRYFVDNVPAEERTLLSTIQAAMDRKFERLILIKADAEAPYSGIMTVFDNLQRAGIENIGLITEEVGGS